MVTLMTRNLFLRIEDVHVLAGFIVERQLCALLGDALFRACCVAFAHLCSTIIVRDHAGPCSGLPLAHLSSNCEAGNKKKNNQTHQQTLHHNVISSSAYVLGLQCSCPGSNDEYFGTNSLVCPALELVAAAHRGLAAML